MGMSVLMRKKTRLCLPRIEKEMLCLRKVVKIKRLMTLITMMKNLMMQMKKSITIKLWRLVGRTEP